jgi:hypothetical protein
MSADIKNPDSQTEDLDLLLLIERGILFFRKFRWLFIVAAVLGLSAGLLMYRSLSKIYQSRLIVHSFLLSNEEEIGIADNWNQLLKKKEYTALATVFNCPENLLHSLKQIKAEEIQKVFSSSNPNGFFIEVNVTDNSILPGLQNGIVYAFNNSPYIKERLDARRGDLSELIDKTSIEIKKLDSTKKQVEDIIGGHGKSSSTLIVDGSSINRQLLDMNEKLLGLREDLKFANAIQVLQGFNKFDKPIGPKLTVWLILGLFVFLSLAYIYALYSSVKAKLKIRSRLRNNPVI